MRILCIDFDGVLHSYISGWKGADIATDPPVDGAISWLSEVIESDKFKACIYSARSSQKGGIECMRRYLRENGLHDFYMKKLHFPVNKPPAFLTIDDRAFCFKGHFPCVGDILRFEPWKANID